VWVADPAATTRTVVIVVFDGVKLLDAAGPAEVFAEANRFGAEYRLTVASVDGEDVTTSIGTRFAVTERISSIDSADTVLVAGGDNLVGRPIDPAPVAALRALPGRTRRLASICTGSFILAEAGLLRGRRATTHWRHAALLARAFPDVDVTPDAIFVRDGDVFTSACPRVSTSLWHRSSRTTAAPWSATWPVRWSSISNARAANRNSRCLSRPICRPSRRCARQPTPSPPTLPPTTA
jgi:transcriptional regulator GlxA family with amidase domain